MNLGGRVTFRGTEIQKAKGFDEAVPDKKAFVKKLRSLNENELADAVASMFRVREGLFGKLFKK